MNKHIEELNILAEKYGTDKHLGKHGYVKHYAKLFHEIKNNNIKILEIGVQEGWSHQMWHDYFPNGTIYGIDITPECKSIENDRIKIEIGDQGDLNFLKDYGSRNGPFDIIIDDGSHMVLHQITSLNVFFPFLKSGGTYVIEDLHTSFLPQCLEGANTNFIEYSKQFANKVNTRGLLADNFANVEKINKYYSYLDYFEQNIDMVSFAKSICFITKQ